MRRIKPTTLAVALAALGCAWLWAPSAYALNTNPMNVADLIRESNQIVVGTVTSVNQGIGANRLPYTEVQVNVAESVLGTSGRTLTFRQFGLQDALPASNGRRYVGLVTGMPQYKAGDAVVLFLGRTSSIGYRTTIGLGHGRFALRSGNLTNELNNAGLFKDLDLTGKSLNDKEKHLVTTTHGAVGKDTFLAFVRRAIAERWWNEPIRKTSTIPQPGSTVAKGGVTAGGSAHE